MLVLEWSDSAVYAVQNERKKLQGSGNTDDVIPLQNRIYFANHIKARAWKKPISNFDILGETQSGPPRMRIVTLNYRS